MIHLLSLIKRISERGNIMCLYVFAYESHSNYRLILASNRDEYYDRPTEKAHFWASSPNVLAGRDEEKYGTWMGITTTGRFGAVTNYRDPSAQLLKADSRGTLVSNFLTNDISPEEHMLKVINKRTFYNGFNLLVADLSSFLYFNKNLSSMVILKPGIYGLSNHYLDTPWPKVKKSKQALVNYLKDHVVVEPESLFEIMTDTETAPEIELPDTGIGLEREKMLSSIFIQGTDYGTKSSTVLLIDHDNHVIFQERSFCGSLIHSEFVSYEFDIT
jgi:uncharacterized protein with NRDE domain